MRADLQDVKAKGIFPSSDVKSRKDPHLTGSVSIYSDVISFYVTFYQSTHFYIYSDLKFISYATRVHKASHGLMIFL